MRLARGYGPAERAAISFVTLPLASPAFWGPPNFDLFQAGFDRVHLTKNLVRHRILGNDVMPASGADERDLQIGLQLPWGGVMLRAALRAREIRSIIFHTTMSFGAGQEVMNTRRKPMRVLESVASPSCPLKWLKNVDGAKAYAHRPEPVIANFWYGRLLSLKGADNLKGIGTSR